MTGLLRRPFVAGVVLLAVYFVLSLANDPGGFLGTDTGGKVATLRAMTATGRLDPDVGYWAEQWDPDGRLHPLFYTYRIGDRWVNATTLPALYAAYPLYRVGGYRLALLLPMLGSVAAALAARALARRLGGGDGSAAFWLAGLASPLAVYALDFWEHSLGVALVGWAVVLLVDVAALGPAPATRRRWWAGAGGAGVLFGAAATMRQEALVYALVATAVTGFALLVGLRRLARPVAAAAVVAAGMALPLLANVALERATLGGEMRGARATGVAAAAGAAVDTRLREGVLTAVSLDPDLDEGSWVVGGAAAVLIAVAVRRAGAGRTTDHGLGRLALGGAGLLYGLRFAGGLAFVPGMLAATPLATAGLSGSAGGVGGARRPQPAGGGARRPGAGSVPRRIVLAVAVLAVPVVWAFQYPGGASAQWGGRYVLASGLLLGVLGAVALRSLAPWARVAIGALAVAVTAFGLVWLATRSSDVARAAAALERRPEPVVVARWAHLAREGGAFSGTERDRRWLTAVTDEDVARAAEIVRQAGQSGFAYVDVHDVAPARWAPPPAVDGFTPVHEDRLGWISGLVLRVVTYSRAGP